MAAIGARRATFSFAGQLLPLLVLALLLQAPSASARHWFWYDALFPVGPSGETNPAAAFTAETEGAAAGAAAAPLAPVAAPAPAPAPAVSCYDVPAGRLIASGAAPDQCAALAAELTRTAGKFAGKTGGQGFAVPSLFRACHSTFQFRKDCDVEDLLSIANAFDNHYVYKHIAVDSPDQTNLPSSIDIVAELRKIVANAEAGKYPRLVDAHMAAFRAVWALNDGHTTFMPRCFMGEFNLPLPLMAVVENAQQIIRVAPRRYITPSGMDHVAKVLHNFDFGLYEGRQVVAINGVKAEKFILDWADKEMGTYRNRASRFTKAFARNEVEGTAKGTNIVQVPGEFARRAFAPENDTLLMSFTTADGSSTEDVEVPWIGTGGLDLFANATAYWKANCAVKDPSVAGGNSVQARSHSSAQASTVEHADAPMIDRFLERHPAPVYYDDTSDSSGDDLNVEIASLSAAAAGPTVTRISPTTDFYLVYLVGGTTAVVWIHKFSPGGAVSQALAAENIDEEQYMIKEVTKALNTAAASAPSRPHSMSHASTLLSTHHSRDMTPSPPSPSLFFPYLPFNPVLLSHSSPSFYYPLQPRSCPSNASQIIIDARGNGGGSVAAAFSAIRLCVRISACPSPCLPPSPFRSNASQIIIDVRSNGGGIVQAAYTAIRLLMGAAKVPNSDFALPMDFIIGTPYTENAVSVLSVEETLYYVGLYTDLNGTALSSAYGYAPFRKLRFTEAGPAGNYSAPIKISQTFTGKQTQPVFGNRPFMFLSDGDCFSACSILTHVLGKRHKVPMVTVGGLPNQPPDVGSSCLGFTQPDIYSMAPGLTKLATVLPENASLPLKVKGAVGMAFTNGYVDSEIPCEFEFLPSQHHINYTVDLIDKPWAMWSEVAKLFASAAA
ncbi:unnamed protein product [Closterium sp. NIES-64]|nr:unnamed protein product [Closterium sp. NIES-64]